MDIEEIEEVISKIRKIFDLAWAYNQDDSKRCELSKMCVSYLCEVEQTLGWLKNECEN